VNRRRISRDDLAAKFADVGTSTESPQASVDALVLAHSMDVTRLPGYAEGLFSVQDGAAQLASGLLDLRDGMHVLDACAAPGGKAAHILECVDVDLLALDRDPQRLPRLHENFARLGLRADVRAGDAGNPGAWWNGRQFDRILLDAPCSATGVIRRQPDIKLHRRVTDISTLAAEQARLLESLWPVLVPGGRLVYATCSLLAEENGGQIARFLSQHADAEPQPVPIGWHAAGEGAQNLPGEGGMDGFFYAIVEKRN
jgi:16S rRNA (cytosine967-C5)-methyltransferase